MQQNGERVLEARAVLPPRRADETGHSLGETKQVNSLVEQMRAQVKHGRTTGDDLVLPLVSIRGGFLGTVAVKMGFKLGDAAEGAVLDELGEGDKVGVPAAVWFREQDSLAL